VTESRDNDRVLHQLRSALATLKMEIELAVEAGVAPSSQALATVDRALDLLGRVESAHLEMGLPPAPDSARGAGVEPSGLVFVVDDDARQAQLLGTQLQRLGFRVVVGSDIREVVPRLTQEASLVVDYGVLQEMDDVTAASVGAVRPIVISGAVARSAAEQARALGATGYLIKPVKLDELVLLLQHRSHGSQAAAP
jgi:CheY-like chemotaxis protein